MSNEKVALITGGASGMGLAAAKVLGPKGWTIHLLDFNDEAGRAAAQSIPGSKFHKVDVTSWDSLSKVFAAIFAQAGRLDFVFANAGIVERDNFYDTPDSDDVPPEPNQKTIDVNLKAVINQSYLALHYFRRSPHKGKDASLVITASVGGLYPAEYCPIYAASKAACVNFMRSIAVPYHQYSGIRVYAICPGTVRTNLLDSKEWSNFPAEYFTPLSRIASTVELLAEGGDLTDARGRTFKEGKNFGLAVEINGEKIYFRDKPEYCDDNMRKVIEATSMANQLERLEEHKAKQNGAK
ncbi:hypothetical protein G7046_g6130 [Stylonectria norvegica]|nr:hypothetical protein G7046_g6130 [Stylonectria norvegica]